jgi:catechol 2,3-dioxygenase-like lactoylglutathione lyase family enzyme
MFDHVTIRVSDPVASDRFYETVLGAIGIERTGGGGDFGPGCPEFAEWGDFSLAAGDEPTTGLHIGFCAWSRAEVDHFWRTGIEAGYRSDGEPDVRPEYGEDYYGAFLLDPDGNSVEAVNHGDMARLGNIDHLWIRVPELDMAQMFYELIAPFSCFEFRRRLPERAHFKGLGSTFALVDDWRPPTRNLHLAFGTDSNATVDRFHAAATAAGYADNGGPGERADYHAGYYAAFVIDPAGANVEVVNHNRADVA